MINLELEDLNEDIVKYSFFYNENEKGFITINLHTLEKQIDNSFNISEEILEKIYEKICWYKKLDNFFAKGFV